MNLDFNPIMEEIIATGMADAGCSKEVIDRCIQDIKYSISETNYTHNSVSNSNFYAYEARKQDERLDSLKKEHEREKKRLEEEMEEIKSNARYRNNRLEQEIERLKNQ